MSGATDDGSLTVPRRAPLRGPRPMTRPRLAALAEFSAVIGVVLLGLAALDVVAHARFVRSLFFR